MTIEEKAYNGLSKEEALSRIAKDYPSQQVHVFESEPHSIYHDDVMRFGVHVWVDPKTQLVWYCEVSLDVLAMYGID